MEGSRCCELSAVFLSLLFLTVGLMRYMVQFLGLFWWLMSSQMMLRYYRRESRWLSSMLIFIFSLDSSTSFLSQNSERKGWRITLSIVIRLDGSNYSIREIRSKQDSLADGTSSLLPIFFTLLSILNTSVGALGMLRLLISASEGAPVHDNTFSSWLRVEVPANSGFPLYISANMHPMLQMSMALEQCLEPTSISGARYQRVAIYQVRTSWLWCASSTERTSPKSQSLAWQFQFTSMLDGLTSRWMSPALWRQRRALTVWQKMYLRCFSVRMPSLISVQRSISMCSNNRYMSLLFQAAITLSSFTMFGCERARRKAIYRQVRWASVELLKASKFFLRASVLRVLRSMTFQTWPYAPLPIFLTSSKRD